jgi:hypothetical protein
MQYSTNPTLLLEIVESTKVVKSMQYLANPTLLLESEESTKVIMAMQSSVNPTLILGSDVSDHVFRISNLVPFEQGDFPLILSLLPPN